MTRTTYFTATTLDGFLADEHHSLDWLLSQDVDPDGPGGHEPFMAGVGSIVMGASTYEWVRSHLERTGEAWSYAQPTWVLTHRDLPRVEGADLRFVAADSPQDVRRLHADLVAAAGAGDVWVVGGGGVAAALAQEGLLDDLVVAIAPVTLGAGKPLLPGAFDLRLASVDRNRAFVAARYEVVGPR